MIQSNVRNMGINISVYWTLILISIWTTIQAVLHMIWIMYAYYTAICKIKPLSYYDFVFVYLTYFYKQDCGQIDLDDQGIFFNATFRHMDIIEPIGNHGEVNKTASEILYEFLKATLANATLPKESESAKRLDIYLTIFFISDGMWILSGILLFVAAVFKLGKHCFLLCYGPWLFMTAFLIFLDVISSVHFGLDLVYIQNFSTWLKFIGVPNYRDFESFNNYDSSRTLSSLPSTIMIGLFSRCFFIWLINVMCFFAVLFRMLGMLYKGKRADKKTIMRRKNKMDSSSGISNDLNLNTTETRIRNWQLFYGAIEANSTMTASNTASNGCTSRSNTTDLNSNEKDTEMEIEKDHFQFTNGRYFNFENDQKNSSHESLDLNGYRRFSDVALDMPNLVTFQETNDQQDHMADMENCNNLNHHYQTQVSILKSQMPWSYISPGGNYLKKKQTLTKNKNKHAVIFQERGAESTQL